MLSRTARGGVSLCDFGLAYGLIQVCIAFSKPRVLRFEFLVAGMAMNPEFIDDRFDITIFDRFSLRPQSLVRIATIPVMERKHDSGVRTTAVPIGKGVVQRTACRNPWNSSGWSDIGKGQRVLLWTRRWGGRGCSWTKGGRALR